MPRTNPFTVTVYSKGLAFQQSLGSAVSYSFTPRLSLGTGEVVTRVDDPANSLLRQTGARMVVVYRGEVLMSGLVQQEQGPVLKGGTVHWYVYDDRYVLTFTRAWVRPGQNLTPASLTDTAQFVPTSAGHTDGRADGVGYYAWPTSPTVYPAETAIKTVIAANLARFGSNVLQGKITVAPDQGRGGDARAAGMLPQLRFDTLQDGLQALLDWSTLVLSVRQSANTIGQAGTITLDVAMPVTWTQAISTGSRIIADGTYQLGIPTLTRLIMGGPGDDDARLFYGINDATGLEDAYGVAVEGFTDATGVSLVWPDSVAANMQNALYYLQRNEVAAADKATLRAYMVQVAATALAAGRNTAGLSISLSETKTFHYGGSDGYHVGDYITVTIDGGPSITQRITECTLTYSTDTDGGFSVSPTVGTISDSVEQDLAIAVAGLAQVVSKLSTRT